MDNVHKRVLWYKRLNKMDEEIAHILGLTVEEIKEAKEIKVTEKKKRKYVRSGKYSKKNKTHKVKVDKKTSNNDLDRAMTEVKGMMESGYEVSEVIITLRIRA